MKKLSMSELRGCVGGLAKMGSKRHEVLANATVLRSGSTSLDIKKGSLLMRNKIVRDNF